MRHKVLHLGAYPEHCLKWLSVANFVTERQRFKFTSVSYRNLKIQQYTMKVLRNHLKNNKNY
jgi:hypothetical protein